MSIKYLLVLISFCLHGTSCLEQTYVVAKVPGTCGLNKAGPTVQKVTRPISHPGGMFWSDANGEHELAFVDRYNPAICRYTPSDGLFSRLPLRDAYHVSSIHPISGTPGYQFVVGINGDLYHVNVTGSGSNQDYTSAFLTHIVDYPLFVLVKGRTDSEGRLWYTSWGPDAGSLYKIEKKKPVKLKEGFQGPTGIAWNGDYTKFYVVDMVAGIVYSYDYDKKKGEIKNKRSVFDMKVHLSNVEGVPTDIVVDAGGKLWIGILKAGQVVHFDPDAGKVLFMISIPAKDVAILEFGGEDLNTLYVGTTTHFLSSPGSDPDAGSIFAVTGLCCGGVKDNNVVI